MARLAVRNFVSALSINNSSANNRVDIGNVATLGLTSGSFSVSYWIKPTKNTGGTQFVFSKDDNAQRGYGFGVNGSMNPYFERNGAGITAAPFVLKLGTYYHVVTTFDGTSVRYYVNAVQSGGAVGTTNPPANTASVNIGRRAYTGFNDVFNGNIDQVVVFSSALTDAQIFDIYYFGKIQSTNPPGPIGQWLFDEGSGTTAIDTSGNGNNGTITGATYTTDTDVPMVARSAATNRTLVQDFKSSLLYPRAGTTATTTVKSGRILQGLSSYTIGAWVKPAFGSGATTAIYCERAAAGNDILKLESVNGTGGVLRMTIRDDAGTLNTIGANSGTGLKDGKWHYAMVTNKAGTIQFYVDGTLVGGGTQTATNTFTNAGMSCRIGSDAADPNATWDGNIADVSLFNVAFTPAEVLTMSKTGNVGTYNSIGRWRLDEGAGTSVTDYSGNGNTGTITGATWTADVPMKARKVVDGNLVRNGDFENGPPFTAATTTTARFIDGTASGSASGTGNMFGWSFSKSGTGSAQFDGTTFHSGNCSLKVSTLATASFVEIFMPTESGALAGYFAKTLTKVLPSTSYTYSFWMKTNVVSGTAATGALISFIESTGDGTTASHQTNTTGVTTTTGWTNYTGVLTTAATARYMQITPHLYGHDGAGTLVMDAWFDDIVLKPTTAEARSTA